MGAVRHRPDAWLCSKAGEALRKGWRGAGNEDAWVPPLLWRGSKARSRTPGFSPSSRSRVWWVIAETGTRTQTLGSSLTSRESKGHLGSLHTTKVRGKATQRKGMGIREEVGNQDTWVPPLL